MIEVPSAVIMADIMADEVDFFSIGTNDLIQYSLAIDRGNRQVAHLYQPFHPAIIRLIKQVAEISREKGIKTYMCGEMAGDATQDLDAGNGRGNVLEHQHLNPRSRS